MPACIVTAIRKTFHEESGNYVGFREADLHFIHKHPLIIISGISFASITSEAPISLHSFLKFA